jgi:desulfoferrodoxin (superoxide reductase-like protein)
MKVAPKQQAMINEFVREYVDRSYKTPMNAVRLNVDHTDAHRRTIFEVCNALLQEKIPFFTEVRLKCGTIPDIVCPTHVVPFIEVLSSETIEMFEDLKLAKYPSEFQLRYTGSGKLKSFIFVDAQEEFSKEDLL